MKKQWKKIAALMGAIILLLSSSISGLVMPATAATSEGEKWVIHDGGAAGTTVTRAANSHVEWSKRAFNLRLPKSLPLDKLGLYIRITLDAATAEAMNKGGSIELAQETCDKSEISVGMQTIKWKVGLNEVLIPIGEQGGYNDGGQARFDMYAPINWFRFYTTPGSANLTKAGTFTIWEVSIMDSTMIGMEFGNDDVYYQLSQPLSGTPNTIEASVKPTQMANEWTLSTPGMARYEDKITSATSGTTTDADETAYGIPAGTSWVGATVHKDGFYGSKDQKFGPVSVPAAYALSDLALDFWLYTSEPAETLPLCSYIELTSSGKCDVDELEWGTKIGAFSSLKAGWNHIVLPFDQATQRGTINLSNLNFIRIWGSQNAQHLATKDIDFRISEMKVVVKEEKESDPVGGNVELVDGLPSWQILNFTKMPRNWDGGKITIGHVWQNDGTSALQPASGTPYMEVTPAKTLTFEANTANPGLDYWKGGFTAGVSDGFVEPKIPSQYTVDDLVFAFWMYVPKAELVPTNQIESPNFEFTSDGNEDGAQLEKRFLFRDAGGLKDGWNYIEVPLSAMSASGGFDLYNINYLRWSFMCTLKDTTGTVNECVRYADFRIKATVNKGLEDTAADGQGTAPALDPNTVYSIFSNAGGDDAATVALYLTADGNVAWTWGDKSYVSSFNAFTGDWIDLALVRDMSAGKFLLYANGTLVDEKSAVGTKDIVPTTAHSIAADAAGQGRFSGWLADVRVWSDVRIAQEIQNSRIPKQGASSNGFDENTQGLLGSWLLIGSTQNILQPQKDVSVHQNKALVRSEKAAQWEDYVIPTDVIGEDYYTIVFIPDTQELVTGRFTEEWLASAQWIADNVEKENIVHVIGAGDNTWTDSSAQWNIVRQGFDLFTNKVSWSNMTGNHDYPGSCLPVNDTTHTIRDTTNYNNCFGMDYIVETKGFDYYVASFEDPYGISGVENSYYRMEINGVKWMILQLEYHPRVHVIEWADSILKQYPDDNVILTTHAYIGNDDAAYSTHWMPYTKQDSEIGGYIGELMPTPTVWPGGSELPIWTELIYPNDNVKLLLCGHASTTDGHVLTRRDKNAAGNVVPQVMINAQDVDVSYFSNEAMGMLGILRFSADGSRCEIQYYSPYHGSSFHPSNQEMRSLTLAVNAAEGGSTTQPDEQPSEQPTEQPDTPTEQPDVPSNDPAQDDADSAGKNGNTLMIILIVGAVLLVAAVALIAVIVKRKKA